MSDEPAPGGPANAEGRTPRPWRAIVVGVVAVVVFVVAGAVVLGSRDDDDTTEAGPEAASIPADALSAPGTALPHGLEVAPGSSLIGPTVVDAVDASGEPTGWFALAVVEDDPLAVWSGYVEQIAERFPDANIDPAEESGCRTGEVDFDEPVCSLMAYTAEEEGWLGARAEMGSVPGDVTGSYVVTLAVSFETEPPYSLADDRDATPWPDDGLPEPRGARPDPGVGEPLAPETVAYDGDNDEYVLLEGSELLTQYSGGSLTGGFAVLLRTAPGGQIDEIASAYADQAIQFEGEPVPPPEVVRHDGTVVTVYQPPGGAGGYSGTVTSIDQPGNDDYILYELYND